MSKTTLSAVAIELIGQYNATGKHLLGAYRQGASRLIQAPANVPAVSFVSEEVRANAAGAREKVTAFLTERLEADTALVAKVMDDAAQRATSGVEYVSAAASRVEAEPGVTVLRTLHDLNLPYAQLSLKLATWVAESAGKLEARVTQAESQAVTTLPVKATRRARAAA